MSALIIVYLKENKIHFTQIYFDIVPLHLEIGRLRTNTLVYLRKNKIHFTQIYFDILPLHLETGRLRTNTLLVFF